MPNINKIKLSGTSYDIQDSNATKTVTLTQAQYDALVNKDPNTFYIISDGETFDPSEKVDTSAFTVYSASVETALSGKAAQSDLSTLSGTVTAHTADTNIHVTSTEKATWNAKSDFSGNYNDLSNKPTIPSKTSDLTNDSDFATTGDVQTATNDMATKTWVGQQGYLTQHQDISGKQDVSGMTAYTETSAFTAHTADTTVHVTANEKSTWNAKSDFSGSYNDLTDKPTIPTVPTSNTAFTNDAGYITEDAISGKADSSAVTEEISAAVSGKVDTSTFNTYSGSVETALSGKQDTLSAGTNITIVDNVISAEGGGKAIVAGRGISVTTGETADTVSFNLPISATTNDNLIIGDKSNQVNDLYNSGDSIVFGRYSKVKAYDSLVGGYYCSNEKGQSQVFGNNTKTKNITEFGCGKYNNSVSGSSTFGDSGNTLFSVGNGTANNARHNAFEIRQNGDIYIADTNDTSTTNYYQKPMIKLQDALGGGGSSYSAGTGIDITNDVISVTGKADTSAVTEVSDALTAHTADTTIHVTSSDKTSWNGAATNASNAVTALGGLSLVKLTQAQYDALATKDSNTLYVIVN